MYAGFAAIVVDEVGRDEVGVSVAEVGALSAAYYVGVAAEDEVEL